MAYFEMTRRMFAGETIEIFNYGDQSRDFTFVDDVVDAITALIPMAPERGDSHRLNAPYRCLNVGGGAPVKLMDFVQKIRSLTASSSELLLVGPRLGDVTDTHCDVTLLQSIIGASSPTGIDDGLRRFVDWFKHWMDTQDSVCHSEQSVPVGNPMNSERHTASSRGVERQ